MDDKFIYYLVLGAIYLISRVLKKKKAKNAAPPSSDNWEEADDINQPIPQSQQPPKPSSFEDLLKEISQEFEGRKEPAFKPIEEVKPVQEFEEVSPPVDELTREQKYVKRKHQEAEKAASMKKLLREVDEENDHEPHAVLELLNEEGGAANAIILSEILNRKY